LVPLSAIQILLVLFAFALSVTVETRFLLGLLPSITVLVMALLFLVSSRQALAGIMVIFAFQWITVNRVADSPPREFANRSSWLLSLHSDSNKYEELTRVVQTTSVPRAYNIVAIEDPWLNANSASFFSAKNRLQTGIRSYYTSLGYAQKDTKAALERIAEFHAPFVVTLDEPFQANLPHYLNETTLPVLRVLEHDPNFTHVPFASRQGILIFSRVEVPSAAVASAGATGSNR
jgi:hypothetical protein